MATPGNCKRRTIAILCGGLSQRLGTDKGLFRPLGDEALVVRAIRRFSPSFDQILVVTGFHEQRDLYKAELSNALRSETCLEKVKVICDEDRPIESTSSGAMQGVLTSLEACCDSEQVWVLPVDQVGVRPFHLDLLEGEGARSFATKEDILPFPSLWPVRFKERLRAQLAAGSFSVKRSLQAANVTTRLSAPYERELAANVNTLQEMQRYFGTPLFDRFSRRMHYLRFSLTEVCNLSCQYCLPEGHPEWLKHRARMPKGNIDILLQGFRRLGFRKVRFTGGEPTVHPGCVDAIREARRLGFEDIALTTNGLLMDHPQKWRDAGLTKINISMDSLREETFHAITKNRGIKKVLNTVEQSIAAGLEVKINAVLMKSFNAREAQELIDWALERPLTLRFIELMPTKLNDGFQEKERVTGSEIEPLLLERGLEKAIRAPIMSTAGPETTYKSPQHLGKIGLINPLSCNFCSDCNRLRVTAQGRVRFCLFADQDVILPLESAESVEHHMRQLIVQKEERHHLENGQMGNVSTFRTIGG